MVKNMFVYKINNKINNKFYIGKTIQPLKKRFNQHFLDAKRYNRSEFHKDMLKYGKDNFEIIGLVECNSESELDIRELEYIRKTKSLEIGYNLFNGITPLNTGPLTEEHKNKIREKFLERQKMYIDIHSKKWVCINPKGEIFHISNLNNFCKDKDIQATNMSAMARGIISYHKGWVCMSI